MERIIFMLVAGMLTTALFVSCWNVLRRILIQFQAKQRKISVMRKFKRGNKDVEISMEIMGGTMEETQKALEIFNKVVADVDAEIQNMQEV